MGLCLKIRDFAWRAIVYISYLFAMAGNSRLVFLVSNVCLYYLAYGNYYFNKRDFTMKKSSFHILRVGVAITFLWIGLLIFRSPEAWGGYLLPWAAGLLPVPMEQIMISTAILDIIIGALLVIDLATWLASLIGAIHLVIVLAVSGITDITVRDIGLFAALLALMIDSWPQKSTKKENPPL